MKNILITGGAGFIGSRLCEKLVEKNYNVTILDNLSPQIHGEGESSLYRKVKDISTFIKGDVRNQEDWKKATHRMGCQNRQSGILKLIPREGDRTKKICRNLPRACTGRRNRQVALSGRTCEANHEGFARLNHNLYLKRKLYYGPKRRDLGVTIQTFPDFSVLTVMRSLF